MKRLLLGLIIIVNYSLILAQPNTGTATIENFQVVGSTFSWELHFQRTGEWTSGLLSNALGSSAASFDFNNNALITPTVQIESGGPLDNANYLVTAQIVSDKCIVDIAFSLNALAGSLPLNVKVKLLTVSMVIDDALQNAGLGWDLSNSGFFDNADNNVITTYVGSSNLPLPVELSSFAAKMYDRDKVKLNWSTQTEVNNYGFDVERQANNGQWEKVGFVNGNGNSNSPKEYSYIDKNLIGGSKFLYRLKQIDNDGQFEYSDIVEVGFVPSKFELDQNYPNPFNPSTKIRYQLPTESKVVIKIYNILGSEVMVLVNEQKEAGSYEAEFNASNLSSGTYIYKINADNFVQTKKMILLK